jgi:hypothetical protein
MKLLATMMILAAAFVGAANAACVITPLADDLERAEAVFVATITRATMSKDPAALRDRERYVVRYDFEVAKDFRGDPSIVTGLTTGARFDDPRDEDSWEQAEQSRYVPGDSILVVAGPGDAPVSSIGCTPSRPWDGEAQSEATKFFAATPN